MDPAPTRRTRRRPAWVSRALALAASAALVAGAAAAPTGASDVLPVVDGPTVLHAGHSDVVSVHLVDGRFDVRVKDDTAEPAVEYRDPEQVLLHVLPSAELVIPDGLDPVVYDVLGPEGSTIWLLDQVQQPGLLWPGFETGGVPLGSVVGDTVEVHLHEVDGPGPVTLLDSDGFGYPTAVWDSGDGLPDTVTLRASTHAHLGWLFTAPGSYRLTVEVTAEDLDGETVTSGEVDYRFHVGPTSSLPAPWATTRAVRALHHGVLDRRPDTSGQAYWAGRLDAGGAPAPLAATLARTPEGRATTVRRAFTRTFARVPSAADSRYWSGLLVERSAEVLRARLLASPEVHAAAGGSSEQWVARALWTALERTGDEASVAFWTGRVDAAGGGWAARERVARAILRSPEARAVDVRYAFQEVCHRELWGQPVPGDLLDQHLAQGLDVGRLRAAVAAGDCAALPPGEAAADAARRITALTAPDLQEDPSR